MDTGLVTSERAVRGMGRTPSSPSKLGGSLASPSITCRSCRVQISMDAIESHECDPNDIRVVAARKSVGETSVLAAAGKVSTALVESFLNVHETPKESVRSAERSDVAAATSASLPQHQDQLRYESLTDASRQSLYVDSPLSSPQSQSGSSSPTHLSRIGRSMLAYLPGSAPDSGYEVGSASLLHGQQSMSSEGRSLIQCRVRGVRMTKDRVALYSIMSNVFKKDSFAGSSISSSLISALGTPPVTTKQEITIERRYREFYAFALTVYAMFPSKELWMRLPPKTLCFLKDTRNDGFLLRRKNGLDDFIRCAIEMMDLGSSTQGTIGQWYLVRKFLNLPATLLATPTKDRSLVAATHELKKHIRQTVEWTPVGRCDEHDTVFEKMCDGFQMVKRVSQCAFPARAIFDMIVKNNQSGGSTGAATVVASNVTATTLLDAKDPSSSASSALAKPVNGSSPVSWNPLVEHEEILRREDGHTWVERTTFKGGWLSRSMQMTCLKSWKVEDNGTIVVVMIPADDRDCTSGSTEYSRVDCIMGGWMITPTPNDETCTVTWLMQANFGECDPRSEFTGSQGLSAIVARKVLLSWASEIVHILNALDQTYVPSYYRALGPLLSGGDLQRIKLERADTSSMCVTEDPRVYVLAREFEPCLCLLIHKSTNKNVLIFKTNLRSKADLDSAAPIKAEWLMFEKSGNPRQDLSPIERTTTYHFATKHIGPNVHHFRLELLRRDSVLRYDPQHGFALFTTINGKPNTLLKRVFLSYAKASSLLSFPKIESVTLVAASELEVLTLQAPTK